MPENRDFSHLPLPFLYRGKPKLRGFNSPSERTNRNRNNRAHHGEYLKRRSSELSQFWKERRINRLEEDLPEIQVGIPILLEIEPSSNIEFLRGLGFEIVCEIEEEKNSQNYLVFLIVLKPLYRLLLQKFEPLTFQRK